MAAGASAGFAVAFRAPVGGMLFGLEELVSFWSLKLGVMIFFCCLFGVITTGVFISSVVEFSFVDMFGLMRTDKYVKFKVLQLVSSYISSPVSLSAHFDYSLVAGRWSLLARLVWI